MLLYARLNRLKQASVRGAVRLVGGGGTHAVNFLVDSGASYTCLLGDTVRRMGVDWGRLREAERDTVTASGKIRLKLLPGAELVFTVRDSPGGEERFMRVGLPVLPLVPPVGEVSPGEGFSVLGMDVLGVFNRWSFTRGWLVLEDVPPGELEARFAS